MSVVPLNISNGHVVFVDAEDFPIVSKHRWSAVVTGPKRIYASTTLRGVGTQYLHRLLLGLRKGQKVYVDHIDGNTLNNSRSNLRLCTQVQNSGNAQKRANSSSHYRGVSRRSDGRYVAEIRQLGNKKWLGSFLDEKDAALAYNRAAFQYYGEFARLNEVSE